MNDALLPKHAESAMRQTEHSAITNQNGVGDIRRPVIRVDCESCQPLEPRTALINHYCSVLLWLALALELTLTCDTGSFR